mgnify:CR=1 FL=1|tara:strand:- start:62 stop:667 length:606 start_codon:yes stop_codon:yes gene_type:complete
MKSMPQASRRDVLYAFSTEAISNTETLERYLSRYPEYRESLIDLFLEISSAPSFDEVPFDATPSESNKQAWSKFQSMLSPADPAAAASPLIQNPLSDLSDQRFRDIADELNINRLFLSRLRDCSIQVATIPRKFLFSLADVLSMTVEHLQKALDGPPIVASGLRHKASGKPGARGKITFEDALTQSGLSEEQQSALRSLKD